MLLLIQFTRLLFHVSNLGVSTCHFAWAFHSEAEEELINMIPAIQRGDPQWSELRAMGIGWWVRNVNTLRRCIEKVTFFHWILKDCHFPFFLILSLLNSRSLFVWSLLCICAHTLFLLSSVFISLPIKAPIPGFFSFPLQNTYTFLFPLLLLYPSCFFFFWTQSVM